MPTPKNELLPGTLDLLVLRVLSRGELHGWGITQRLEQLSQSALQVDEGSLYPALYRMEEKGWIARNGDGVLQATAVARRDLDPLTRASLRYLEQLFTLFKSVSGR